MRMMLFAVLVCLYRLFHLGCGSPANDSCELWSLSDHPDDAEYKAGGTSAKWAKQGHHVKLVSVTDGDIGHWQMAGGPLAVRRSAEAAAAAKVLGVTSQVLDIHDGELLPTLENRRTITRIIREWRADIVISHRPWDYHPDHRNVGVLVQDTSLLVTVPFFCPDTKYFKEPRFSLFQRRIPAALPISPGYRGFFRRRIFSKAGRHPRTDLTGLRRRGRRQRNAAPQRACPRRRSWAKAW